MSSPDSAFLFRELGAVERQAGASDNALKYLRRATELDPGDAGTFAQIGEHPAVIRFSLLLFGEQVG